MADYVDIWIKIAVFIGGVASAAASLAWWLGNRLDKITNKMSDVELRTYNHISRVELRLSQRLTRLETKLNGTRPYGSMSGDESHDD